MFMARALAAEACGRSDAARLLLLAAVDMEQLGRAKRDGVKVLTGFTDEMLDEFGGFDGEGAA
jgi:hypothetical protein